MKNYAKTILYAYPFLETVGEDYEEHIRNKAVLSYDSRWQAERLTEYLAEEILRMRRLEWLKGKVEEALSRLTDGERELVALRYFGGGRKRKWLRPREGNPLRKRIWTERTYFRRQQRLGEKICGLFVLVGISEEVFEQDFAALEPFARIGRYIAEGKDKKIAANERRWLDGR